ncbi:M48 family metallopeptidase [Acidovorax sp. DW039]|uniref:M48 family metallopeptidase n=1 Tax=Acidovorax sp. DW039 TaxID=3095606 RepID=UPI00308FC6B1|nr:M48 family metallopeptidase [Acidovorax sp. DW039]
MAFSIGEKVGRVWNLLPSSAKLVLWSVCIPLLLAGIGVWEYRQYEQPGLSPEHQELLGQIQQAQDALRENPRTQITIDGRALSGIVAKARLQQIERRIREDSDSQNLVGKIVRPGSLVAVGAGLLAAAVALVGFFGVNTAGRKALQSRDALMAQFARWRSLLPTYLSVHMGLFMVSVAGLLAARLGVAYQVVVIGHASKGEVKLQMIILVVAGTVLWCGVTLLRALYKSLRELQDEPSTVMGVAVSRQEAPALWSYVETLAQGAGAATPAHLVVGLTDGFYVTAHAMRLMPSGQELRGETMYLPLTYLTLLERDEISAILAHELGHFAGSDTAYSLRFSPIYQGLVANLQAIYGRKDSSDWMDLPATSFIEYLLERFDLAVKHWSREREFAADQVAARLVSGEAVARSLVRVTALNDVVYEVLSDIGRRPQEAGSDVVQMLHDAVQAKGLTAPNFATEVATVHPTDTHPPTLERAKAVNAPVTDAMVQAALTLPDAQALAWVRSLFADSQGLQARLLNDFKGVAQEHNEQVRKDLTEAVQQAQGSLELYERRNNVWLFGGVALVALISAVAIAAQAVVAGKSFAGVRDVVMIALACFGGLAGMAWLFWRRSSVMVMQLTAEGMRVPGWPQVVPWSAVADYSSTVVNGSNLVMTFDLDPAAPRLQAPHTNLRRVTYRPQKNKLVVGTTKIKGMDLEAVHEAVLRYLSGWHARKHLESM